MIKIIYSTRDIRHFPPRGRNTSPSERDPATLSEVTARLVQSVHMPKTNFTKSNECPTSVNYKSSSTPQESAKGHDSSRATNVARGKNSHAKSVKTKKCLSHVPERANRMIAPSGHQTETDALMVSGKKMRTREVVSKVIYRRHYPAARRYKITLRVIKKKFHDQSKPVIFFFNMKREI